MSNPLHRQMIEIFHDWYLAEKKLKYKFLPAQCKAIDLIYDNILALYVEKECTNEGVLNTWKYLLQNMKKNYDWLYDNCDLTVINSKFNILVDRTKSQKQNNQTTTNYSNAMADIMSKMANYGKK